MTTRESMRAMVLVYVDKIDAYETLLNQSFSDTVLNDDDFGKRISEGKR